MKKIICILLSSACYSEFEVKTHGEWINVPNTIEFCSDNNVKEDRILEQVNWWHDNLNYHYPYFNKSDVIYSSCNADIESNTLRIQRAYPEEMFRRNAFAWASYKKAYTIVKDSSGYFKSVNYIDACTINVNQLNSNWILRHEVGHCWGWSHTESSHHLMSPHVGRELSNLENIPSDSWEENG